MSGHQTATIEDTVYFWFASHNTSGSGNDGASALFDVREAGAAASAIPLLSGTPALLSHANFPAGCYEIAVAATTGNGFAADDTFAVFCTLAVDSQNPTGMVGSCTLTPLAKAAALQTVDNEIATIDTNVDSLNLGIIYGLAQTGTLSTTACTTDLSGFLDDELINRVIVFTGGTADGQAALITDYASASGLVTFTGGITTAPANNDTIKLI